MKSKKKSIIWSIVTTVLAVIMIALYIGGSIANLHKTAINDFLGLETYTTEGVTGEDKYKSDYAYTKAGEVSNANSLWNDSVKAANQTVEEGTVMLWNDGNALPFASGSKLSLFSRSSVSPTYSGIGSGLALTTNAVNLVDSLKNVGFGVNESLVNAYKNEKGDAANRGEVAWSKISDLSFTGYGDCAIFVLSTVGGEEKDLAITGASTTTGDYLNLSQAERDTLAGLISLKASGTFKKVVLLINTCSSINFRALEEFRSGIDACLWVGQPGGVGFTSVAEILKGTKNPGGCLPDTFTYDSSSVPAVACYGDFAFASADGLNQYQQNYITYSEGIYVGYRYFETRYEDVVLGHGNASSHKGATLAGDWNYGKEVAFPFGHSLSYTRFELSDITAEADAATDSYNLSVKVKNTGSVAGKKTVQVYLQKPYTENGVEKAAVELVGYAKTASLEQNQEVRVTINVSRSQFASYDADVEKTYILEDGDYYLTAASNAHEAVNNILAAKGKTVADGMDAEGNENFVHKVTISDELKVYSKSSTGKDIVNQFDHADWNKGGYSSQTITYLSRSDYDTTFPAPVSLTATAALKAALAYNKDIVEEGAQTPTYGAEKKYSLFEMADVPYGDAKWDEFMNQITLEETSLLLAQGYKNTAPIKSLDKPGTYETDGPLGAGGNYRKSKHVTLSFPTAPTLAATFNDELSLLVGKLKGESMLHSGCNGLYGTENALQRPQL